MPNEFLPDSILKTIDPQDAISYAQGSGWVRNDRVQEVAVFSHPNRRFIQVVLPLTSDVDDLAFTIGNAIRKFSEVENRDASQILNEILLPKSDFLRFQIEGPRTNKGMVQVEEGLKLYNGVRGVLLASACGVVKPKKYYARLGIRAAQDFLDACWLGQTERSSYVATVSCPMKILPERREDDIPFARQATSLLLNTMSTVSSAIASNQEERLLNLQDENIVVSANLCEAIVAMQPSNEQSTLRVRCTWAKALPLSDMTTPQEVKFAASQMETIAEVAKALRPSTVIETVREYIGTIEKLQSEPDIASRQLGEVTVIISVAGVPKHVRVELPPREYAVACNAHRDGNAVRIRGILQRGIRTHRIDSPQLFEIIPRT